MKPWDDIVLTDEEKEAAIVEGKKRKYFHERNKEYWEKQEKPRRDYRGLMERHEKAHPPSGDLGEIILVDD